MRHTLTLPAVADVRHASVEWELKPGNSFTASGTIKYRDGGESGGQNLGELAKLYPEHALLQRIVTVWRRWHLNDLKAGCEHQRAEGWDKRPIYPDKPLGTYVTHPNGSSTWNMLTWVSPKEHPGGLLGVACPTCGYKYGTAWLREEIPADVIEEIQSWSRKDHE